MKRIKFILVALLITPFGCLPLSWSQAMGGWLGRNLLRLNKKRLHITRCNIRACFPGLSEQGQEEMLKRTGEETGKWFFEAAYVWFRDPKFLTKRTTVVNPELLAAAYNERRGVVIIMPHLGNFEVLNFYVPFHYPFGAMYKPVKSELVEDIIFSGRSRVGTSMFSSDRRGVRSAFKHLKKGKVLVVLSDHLPSTEAGVFAPFFGVPAHTGKLTHALVKRNQSVVLLATTLRKANGEGFEIAFHPVSGMLCDDSVEAATCMNKAIEDAVRLAPAQYQWVYKRFSRQPEGYKSIYTA
jgi:KDO2-lipid IV(A) lauroyltransferase